MLKLRTGLEIALLALAAAGAVAPAKAETPKGDNYQCHFLQYMADPASLIKAYLDGVATIEQCYALCDGTPGCVAVQWSQGMTIGNQKVPPSCKLYKSAKSMSGSAPEPAGGTFSVVTSTVCVKKILKYKPDGLETFKQVPQIPPLASPATRLDPRPGPRPGPGPGPAPGRQR
jgi:hypothetical protein